MYSCWRQDVPRLKDVVRHCLMYSQLASNEALYHLWLFLSIPLSSCNSLPWLLRPASYRCVWLCCNGQSMFGLRQALKITGRILVQALERQQTSRPPHNGPCKAHENLKLQKHHLLVSQNLRAKKHEEGPNVLSALVAEFISPEKCTLSVL